MSGKGPRRSLADSARREAVTAVDRGGWIPGACSSQNPNTWNSAARLMAHGWNHVRWRRYCNCVVLSVPSCCACAQSHALIDSPPGKIVVFRKREFVGRGCCFTRWVAYCRRSNRSNRSADLICTPFGCAYGASPRRNGGRNVPVLVAGRPVHRFLCGRSTENDRCHGRASARACARA